MAIKGKKKRRSSGPPRRPTGAPRPTVSQRRPPTWYNSPTGAIVAGVVAAGIVALIVFLIVNAVGNSGTDVNNASAAQLKTYSSSLTSLRQTALNPVIGMVDISGKNPDLSHVPAEGSTWVQTLQQMEGTVSNQPVSTALRGVNSVFSSAINEYRNAATAYILAAQLPKAKQASGVTVAKSERLQGDSLWATAVDLLNSQRSAAGLSRLTLPNPGVAPAPPPSTKSPSPKKSSGG